MDAKANGSGRNSIGASSIESCTNQTGFPPVIDVANNKVDEIVGKASGAKYIMQWLAIFRASIFAVSSCRLGIGKDRSQGLRVALFG